MSETKLLNAVLDGTQVPHQPLLVITETSTYSGLPLFREVIRRSEQAYVHPAPHNHDSINQQL